LAPWQPKEKGEDLRTRQEGSGKLYVLKEGRDQFYVALPHDAEVTLTVVEAGSIFGKMALTGDRMGEGS
jgi:CRP-like cAMP-binding protein